MEKTETLHARMHRVAEAFGSLLVDAFHYLALGAMVGISRPTTCRCAS